MPIAQTRQTSQFPTHFARDTSSHSLSLIYFAVEEFNKTTLDSSCSKALKKLDDQTTKGARITKDPEISTFLAQKFQDTNEFKALASEYDKLKKLQGKPHIAAYIKAAERSIKSIREKFDIFLAAQKRQFNEAYKAACAEQHERDALWKKYEKSLRTKMLGPIDKFAHEINHDVLLSQTMIHFLNRKSDDSTATYQNGKIEEKFIPQSLYKDGKEMPINVQYDKKTGKATEIRVNALSGTFFGISGKALSGDLGDAFAIAVASHAKDLPIKIVVPVSQLDYLRAEMDPGLMQGLVMLVAWCFQKLEQRHYKNRVAEATVEKGISLDNISLIDPHGQPLVFSPKFKAKVKEKLEEWEKKFAEFEMKQEPKFNPQPHLVATAA